MSDLTGQIERIPRMQNLWRPGRTFPLAVVKVVDTPKIFKKLQLWIASWVFSMYSFNCKAPHRSENKRVKWNEDRKHGCVG